MGDETKRPGEEHKMQEMRKKAQDQEEIDNQFNREDRKEETTLTNLGPDQAQAQNASENLDLGGPSQENEESKKLGNQRNRAKILKLREAFQDVFGSAVRKTDNPKLITQYDHSVVEE